MNQDQRIGTWQIVSLTEDGDPVVLSECELTETIVFTSSKVTFNDAFEDFEGECRTEEFTSPYILEGNQLSTGTDLDDLPIELENLLGDLVDVEDLEIGTSEITTLNETTLVIRDTFEDEEDTEVDVTTYRKL